MKKIYPFLLLLYILTGYSATAQCDSLISTAKDISGLPNGNYKLVVTTANGCTAVWYSNIETQNDLLAGVAINSQNSCGVNNSGSLTVNATGGGGGYTYLWSNGATSQTISNLANGIYRVTVTAGTGCSKVSQATILTTGNNLTAAINLTAKNTCTSNNLGALEAYVPNGSGSYTYLWNNGQTASVISGLPNGNYTVTVTAPNGCTAVASKSVIINNTLVLNTNVTNNTCTTTNAGSIQADIQAGSGGYTYLWSTGETTPAISNLVNGNYIVSVTASDGCTATATASISKPNIFVTYYADDNICPQTQSGIVGVNALESGLTYLWSTGATTSSIQNLAEGNYSITITSANGCTAMHTYNVETRHGMLLSSNAQHNYCGTTSDGSFAPNITGTNSSQILTYQWYRIGQAAIPTIDTVNYTLSSSLAAAYQWYLNGQAIDGATSQTHTPEQPGTYMVEVTDANGCMANSAEVNMAIISGINTLYGGSLKLYPNPATDVLTVDGLPGNTAKLLQVYELTGKVVEQQTETNKVNVSQLAAGIYVLLVTNGAQKQQFKFVKQ